MIYCKSKRWKVREGCKHGQYSDVVALGYQHVHNAKWGMLSFATNKLTEEAITRFCDCEHDHFSACLKTIREDKTNPFATPFTFPFATGFLPTGFLYVCM